MPFSQKDKRLVPLPKPPLAPATPGQPPKRAPRVNEKTKKAIAHLLSSSRPDIAEAAAAAGMKDAHALREQLKFPHVRNYLFAERRALVAAAAAGNPAALVQIRDKGDNAAAAVKAAQVIEQLRLEDEQQRRGSGAGEVFRPGLVVVINQQPAAPGSQPEITITPESDPAIIEDAGYGPGQRPGSEFIDPHFPVGEG